MGFCISKHESIAVVVAIGCAALERIAWSHSPGSGFGIQGSGFRVQGAGFRVQGSGFRVQASGFRSQGSGFRVYESIAVVLAVSCAALARIAWSPPPPPVRVAHLGRSTCHAMSGRGGEPTRIPDGRVKGPDQSDVLSPCLSHTLFLALSPQSNNRKAARRWSKSRGRPPLP